MYKVESQNCNTKHLERKEIASNGILQIQSECVFSEFHSARKTQENLLVLSCEIFQAIHMSPLLHVKQISYLPLGGIHCPTATCGIYICHPMPFYKRPYRSMLQILHASLSALLLLCVTLSPSDSLHFRIFLESLEQAFT